MIKLSTCMFLKNEGTTIYRCLESCTSFTDEFVVGIDLSCTDNTESEVDRFISDFPESKVIKYSFNWMESFAYHRNEGMDKATGDWILVMDGHEFFPDNWMSVQDRVRVRPRDVMCMIKKDFTKNGILFNGEEQECDDVFINLYQQPFIGETPNNFFMQPRIYRNGLSKVDKYKNKKIRFGRAAHNTILYTRPELSVQYPEVILIHDAPEDNRKERAVQRQEMNIKQLRNDLKENSKDTRALFYLGNTYLEGKKIGRAIVCYRRYIKYAKIETDEAYQVYLHMALAYRELGNHQEAIKCLYQSVRINCEKRDAYLLVGDCYFSLEEYKKAIQNYNHALSIPAPVSRMFSNGGTYTWLPHQQLAQAFKASGNIEMAIAHLKICLGYVKNEGWIRELKELSGDKQNILIVDHLGSFTEDFRKYLENKNYNLIVLKEFSRAMALWADRIFVEWADFNAVSASEFKGKTVIRIHGYEAYLNKHLFNQIPWDCKGIIYVADHIKDMIGKDGHVVHNGVNTEEYYIKSRDRIKNRVGVVGFMNGKKNPMRLAQIIKNNPDMQFELRIDWQDEFLKSAFMYETEKCKNINYHGRYEHLSTFYNQVQFIMSTSDIESFSYAIAEGMACGCTPLIYNWKGAKQLWREDFIFTDNPIFEAKDMDEMREYIIENYPLHKQMLAMETILIGD